MERTLVAATLSMAILFASGGCTSSKSNSAKLAATRDAFAPDALPYERGVLQIGTHALPFALERERQKDRVEFRLLIGGRPAEYEQYQLTSDSFLLEGFGIRKQDGEAFDPPLPLLKFPIQAGVEGAWGGKIIDVPAKLAHSAKAKVRTGSESLDLPEGRVETLKVLVNLEIESGAKKPALRSLTFWFVPGKGIVERDFQAISRRGPAK